MNLKYMKVSLFEISYKKKFTFSRHSNLLRCTCILAMLCVALFFPLVYLLTKSNIFQEFIPCMYICTAVYINNVI